MGFTRTPRPHYFEHGVVEFFVRDRVVHYKTSVWIEGGTLQFEFEQGKYNESLTPINEIVSRALQRFGSVSK